eukprot:6214468-Pleurochrysis_carterae.AAC.2
MEDWSSFAKISCPGTTPSVRQSAFACSCVAEAWAIGSASSLGAVAAAMPAFVPVPKFLGTGRSNVSDANTCCVSNGNLAS